jgi:ArsR family transcriptional regulator
MPDRAGGDGGRVVALRQSPAVPSPASGARQPPAAAGGAGITLARIHLTRHLTNRLAAHFKALGDPVRLQLLSMIAAAPTGEVCVCDLTPAFNLTNATISHHLRVLREAGLVCAERRGSFVYYRACITLLRGMAASLLLQPGSLVCPAERPARRVR